MRTIHLRDERVFGAEEQCERLALHLTGDSCTSSEY